MTISSNQPVSNFTQQNKTANFLIDRGLRRTQNTRSRHQQYSITSTIGRNTGIFVILHGNHAWDIAVRARYARSTSILKYHCKEWIQLSPTCGLGSSGVYTPRRSSAHGYVAGAQRSGVVCVKSLFY